MYYVGMDRPLALIDLDGTVADYDGSMSDQLKLLRSPEEPVVKHGRASPPHIKNRTSLIRNQPGFWRNLEVIKEGVDVIQLLMGLDFSLMVLTKGPASSPNAWTEKALWCREHLPQAKITITEDKANYYGKVLFDDWPEYVEPWLKHRPRGLVIMLEHPWNAGYEHPQVFKYRRVQSIDAWKDQRGRLVTALIEVRDR